MKNKFSNIAYQFRWSVGDDFKINISTKSNAVESNHSGESDARRICITFLEKMFQMTYKYNSVSSEDFGLLKFPWKKVQHSASGWYAHDLRYMFVVTWSSPPWRLINFFLKMTTRGKISLRDIAHKITFFQSLARFICLKRLLFRTLDVNIAKLDNI